MKLANQKLLDTLNKDENLYDRSLYSAGPYWSEKAKKINYELQHKGLDKFRGYDSGVGTSYCDNIVTNLWNEEVSCLNNILEFIFCNVPIFKRVGLLFKRTRSMLIDMHEQKLRSQEALLKENNHLKNLLNTFKVEDTINFGCVELVKVGSKLYSTCYLELLNTLSFISEKIDFHQIRSMFEIGGGFGANVHLMLQNCNHLKKIVYLDIVPNLFVGTEYLRAIYGSSVRDYLETKNYDKIKFSNDNDLEIYCIAPWQMEKLDLVVDYFHNANSFVEMPENVVKNYSYYIEKIISLHGKVALVSYDCFSEDTTFNPKKLLSFCGRDLCMYEYQTLINPERKNYCFIS